MLDYIKNISSYKKLLFKEILIQVLEKGLRIVIGLIVINKMAVYLGPNLFGVYNYVESFYLIVFGLSVF